ncbi:MAG: hypothetical protein AAFV96_09420, partial [Pseudomonadota bacterium]
MTLTWAFAGRTIAPPRPLGCAGGPAVTRCLVMAAVLAPLPLMLAEAAAPLSGPVPNPRPPGLAAGQSPPGASA